MDWVEQVERAALRAQELYIRAVQAVQAFSAAAMMRAAAAAAVQALQLTDLMVLPRVLAGPVPRAVPVVLQVVEQVEQVEYHPQV
jgi:hypothetical protein